MTAIADTAAEFHQHGFTHVPSLLTVEEVVRFRTAALEFLYDQKRARSDVGSGITGTADAWEDHPVLRELALHPGIGQVAERIAGMSLRVWDGEVLNKEPRATTETRWHDDLTFTFLDSRLTFNAWIALADISVDSGCMTFLPGSHRRGGPYRVDLSDIGEDSHGYLFRHWPELRWSNRVTIPIRAGGGTFHHWRTAHAAGGNTTANARIAFVITYTDAQATYRPQSGYDPLELERGEPLPGERYPLVSR